MAFAAVIDGVFGLAKWGMILGTAGTMCTAGFLIMTKPKQETFNAHFKKNVKVSDDPSVAGKLQNFAASTLSDKVTNNKSKDYVLFRISAIDLPDDHPEFKFEEKTVSKSTKQMSFIGVANSWIWVE